MLLFHFRKHWVMVYAERAPRALGCDTQATLEEHLQLSFLNGTKEQVIFFFLLYRRSAECQVIGNGISTNTSVMYRSTDRTISKDGQFIRIRKVSELSNNA